jgi:transcriptional regulator with XRE-family HTH domain
MPKSLDLNWLRTELRAPGRSQTDLARHLGMHVSAVNKILSGTRAVKLAEYESIEAYLALTSAASARSLPGETGVREAEEAFKVVTDNGWVLTRVLNSPPGLGEKLERRLLSLLTDEDDYGILGVSQDALSSELSKAIILEMRQFNERRAATLQEHLSNTELLVTLSVGLGIIDEFEARPLKAVFSAFSTAIRDGVISGVAPEEVRVHMRRAAGAHQVDDASRVRLKYVRFVLDLYDKAVRHQIARRDQAERAMAAIGQSRSLADRALPEEAFSKIEK